MYMAVICGYTEVRAFSEDEKKAKRLALKRKKELCKYDLDKWSWEIVENYYGAYTEELHEGLVLD